jgi:5-(carboxyamino)imidazole ribonucleotide synthase
MLKLGILGGGQLGRMLLQAAANYHVKTYVLENSEDCPSASLCHFFMKGDIRHFDDVYRFGKQVDVLTIEIENVNIEALYKLESEGIKVIPTPSSIAVIKDKGAQKQFYADNNIQTAAFELANSASEIIAKKSLLPFAQKLREGGYDGKGVQIIHNEDDFKKLFDEPSVIEKLADIEKELSVLVAVGQDGSIVCYEPSEMVFDSIYNLVDYLLAPALIPDLIKDRALIIAKDAVQALDSPGLFAVELFYTKNGEVLVNEIAPRAHNSGHATIEANSISQYDMQLRIMLSLPLGEPLYHHLCAMLNLIGDQNANGKVKYEGIEEALSIQNVYIHLYGKEGVKPGRKMGHVTILDCSFESLKSKLSSVKNHIKVVSYEVNS